MQLQSQTEALPPAKYFLSFSIISCNAFHMRDQISKQCVKSFEWVSWKMQ